MALYKGSTKVSGSGGGVTSVNGQTGAVTVQATLVSGTNIKTINSNSILGSGNLSLNDVKVASSAPSNATEGMVWYDTTNDKLKVYDGSQWNEVGGSGGGNVIAMTQSEYDNLSSAEKADGKLRIITDAPSVELPSYESLDAVSGGTSESLVTTGEKYIWDNKIGELEAGAGITVSNINNISTNIKGVELLGPDYSAMRGPCPEGYHVPTLDECNLLKSMLDSMSLNTESNIIQYLKFPKAGDRNGSSSNVENQSTEGRYHSCYGGTRSGATTTRYIKFNSSGISIASGDYYGDGRAQGRSIRPFKDIPVIPGSYVMAGNWQRVYSVSGSNNAGIWYSSQQGLISISADGETWLTITDKNLGATTVYTSGATLSEANCGKYYQWGNNYGFPRTGSVTKKSSDSAKVNAQLYGPGNFYSGSTFVTYTYSGGGNCGDWAVGGQGNTWNKTNANLWGSLTGIDNTSADIIQCNHVVEITSVTDATQGAKVLAAGEIYGYENVIVKLIRLTDPADSDVVDEERIYYYAGGNGGDMDTGKSHYLYVSLGYSPAYPTSTPYICYYHIEVYGGGGTVGVSHSTR